MLIWFISNYNSKPWDCRGCQQLTAISCLPGTLPSSITCSLDTTCPSLSAFCAKLMTVLGASRPANCEYSTMHYCQSRLAGVSKPQEHCNSLSAIPQANQESD